MANVSLPVDDAENGINRAHDHPGDGRLHHRDPPRGGCEDVRAVMLTTADRTRGIAGFPNKKRAR